MTSLHAGHDVRYFTEGAGTGGCAGAMSYYTAAGEPPGQWTGKAAARLGLTGRVDAAVIERLYMRNTSPGGEVLAPVAKGKKAEQREAEAAAAYLAAHPYASPGEVAEARAAARGNEPRSVPYFDFTISAAKSVSVLHASLRVSAVQARKRGEEDLAADLDSRAQAIEDALMETAREVVGWLERHAAYTRTGHHSATTGEWRDADGLVAALFLHHISRDGDPQLHVHVPVWNRVQRADGADGKWRTLDSRTLHNQRLGAAALADKTLVTKLSALGYVMVPRADGNGAEIGGVSQEIMDLFSSRSRAITPQLQTMIDAYEKAHGRPPSKRTIWLMGQQAAQNTRRSKAEARRRVAGRTGSHEPGQAERFAAWEDQTTREETAALSAVHPSVGTYRQANQHRRVKLNETVKARTARIAVAEVQQHHAVWSMAQLRFEVARALPILPARADANSIITEIAKMAVTGRAGTGAVCVTAPDVLGVDGLGTRHSDRGSVYRPPQEDRYTTVDQLDAEEHILTLAAAATAQLVDQDQARAAVTGTGLNSEQADAVVALLSSATAAAVLTAPAGAGKSHAMAVFARLWGQLTGRRVIGLATSTNAARVLQREGLAEAYNIAQFLGKTEGSDKLRHPVPLHAGDILVIDEASQVSTADLAALFEAARTAGARIVLTGDTAQLGSPEAGGMLRLLAAQEAIPSAQLHEVRRFDAAWEREASIRLRDGDFAAIAVYDRHGRIRGDSHEAAYERATAMWLADHLRGKDTLLLAGSNTEAADLARRVQGKLIAMGQVNVGGYHAAAALADGNTAHPGDLIRARLNTRIDADGQPLTNRDTLRVVQLRGQWADVARQLPDRSWTVRFTVPVAYLAQHAELAYAGNVHVAQGRTTDTAHLLVTDTLSRQSLYVGMTRGREANTAHVVTGETAPDGKQPYERATPESVLKNAIDRDDADLSATEAIRQSQEWAGGTGHLLNLWTAAVHPALHADIDQQLTTALTEADAARYTREHVRPVLHQALTAAHLAGHDVHAVIGQITAAPLDGARSVSAVLHGRLRNLDLPDRPRPASWADRTPASAPQAAHEIAAALDHRVEELGTVQAANPDAYIARHLGVLSPDASPAVQADYIDRAGSAASYREAAAITNPDQAIASEPHQGRPELEAMRRQTIHGLEIADQAARYAAMGRGQLEAIQQHGQRLQATAPPDVSAELRHTAQAEDDARTDATQARARGDDAAANEADHRASILGPRREQLENEDTHHQAWAGTTRPDRDDAGKASNELNRRGHQPATPRPETKADNQAQHDEPTAPTAAPQTGADQQLHALHETVQQIGAQQVLRQAYSHYAARLAARQAETQPEAHAQAEPARQAQHDEPEMGS